MEHDFPVDERHVYVACDVIDVHFANLVIYDESRAAQGTLMRYSRSKLVVPASG